MLCCALYVAEYGMKISSFYLEIQYTYQVLVFVPLATYIVLTPAVIYRYITAC